MILIYPRVCFAADTLGFLQPKDNSNEIERYSVGDKYVCWAGSPGIGKKVYSITRIDSDGIWGVLESDTMRELEGWECR